MFCKKCGSPLSDNAAFCEKCGTPVADGASAAPETAAPGAFPEATVSASAAPEAAPTAAPEAAPTAAPVPPAGGPVPGGAAAPAGAVVNNATSPAGKKKTGLIIGIIVAIVVIICILLAVLLGGGGGGNNNPAATGNDISNPGTGISNNASDPIVGKWTLAATIDSENDNEVTPIFSDDAWVEFESNGSATLRISSDLVYDCTWSYDSEMTAALDEGTAYAMECSELPDFIASITEICGEDGLFIIISGLQYGMFFQR